MNIKDPRYFNPTNLPNELWKDIPGFESEYEVSSEGRVRSIERYIYSSRGDIRLLRAKILTPYDVNKRKPHCYPSYSVTLASGGRDKHHYCRGLKKLIADAFLDPLVSDELHLVCIEDNLDFKVDNLIYVSMEEYSQLYPSLKIQNKEVNL